ncbi:hypothetical protein APS56_00030 [Pseudalgibacter alginicilyticus]|uniref:DinB family protein n=1 Tax=Pseudalgibacter alginicilyticus TaxID=1736674 RepID=A0A0P0CLS3_9FLAO|nr:hypothetical protein [Pseudalgibacter alginicilyticus]ALJ03632.1 hypothetical protein APS56_00030 [Pseudalgibacter alginicilyticus]
MNAVIQSTLKTLQKSQSLLEKLTDYQLCNASVSPYYSSIGTHLRHILDFYECVFNDNPETKIDLTSRSRNKEVEQRCDCAKDYLNLIITKLKTSDFEMNKTIFVTDDLGLGIIEIPYTYGALLAQANSHTIHHYAIINYILDNLGIVLEDADFGYNPTTPK